MCSADRISEGGVMRGVAHAIDGKVYVVTGINYNNPLGGKRTYIFAHELIRTYEAQRRGIKVTTYAKQVKDGVSFSYHGVKVKYRSLEWVLLEPEVIIEGERKLL
jgi:hypothetical protein